MATEEVEVLTKFETAFKQLFAVVKLAVGWGGTTTVPVTLSVQVPFEITKVTVFVPTLLKECVAFAPDPLGVPSPHSQV